MKVEIWNFLMQLDLLQYLLQFGHNNLPQIKVRCDTSSQVCETWRYITYKIWKHFDHEISWNLWGLGFKSLLMNLVNEECFLFQRGECHHEHPAIEYSHWPDWGGSAEWKTEDQVNLRRSGWNFHHNAWDGKLNKSTNTSVELGITGKSISQKSGK